MSAPYTRHVSMNDRPTGSERRCWVVIPCKRCRDLFGFWRWKRERPEPRVCATCARDQWETENRGRNRVA